MVLKSPSATPELKPKPLEDSSDESDSEELTKWIHPDLQLQEEEENPPQSACQWHNCGQMFSNLQQLVSHIHAEHVGTSKSTYKCMWEGCGLFNVTRTSRFALIGHIRSHTGERPFTCKLPECDKSFTRSDALTKHMRVVHGMETQFPIKGNAKKRKREDSDVEEEPFVAPDSNGEDDDAGDFDEDDVYNPKSRRGRGRKSKGGPIVGGVAGGVKTEGTGTGGGLIEAGPPYSDSDSEEYLADELDSETGLVHGCRPWKAKYLICKAKYRYAVAEHETLLETLKHQQEEVERLRVAKDDVLNDLLRRQYGDEPANELIAVKIERAPRVA